MALSFSSHVLIASGVNEINYINDYKNDELVKYFTKEKNIKVEKI